MGITYWATKDIKPGDGPPVNLQNYINLQSQQPQQPRTRTERTFEEMVAEGIQRKIEENTRKK